MKRIKMLAGILATMTAASGLLLACGEDEKPAAPSGAEPATQAESAAPAEPAAEEPGAFPSVVMPPIARTPKSAGEELAVKIELPDFYPADGPVYPDTPPSRVFVKGDRINLMFGTDDTPEEVLEFMNAELPRLGWNNAEVERVGDIVSIQATKPGRDLAVIMAVVDPGRSTQTTLITVGITD
jgi:hypothetical protein